jgi:hypothetical protein
MLLCGVLADKQHQQVQVVQVDILTELLRSIQEQVTQFVLAVLMVVALVLVGVVDILECSLAQKHLQTQ